MSVVVMCAGRNGVGTRGAAAQTRGDDDAAAMSPRDIDETYMARSDLREKSRQYSAARCLYERHERRSPQQSYLRGGVPRY